MQTFFAGRQNEGKDINYKILCLLDDLPRTLSLDIYFFALQKQKIDDKAFGQKAKGYKKSSGTRTDYFEAEDDTTTVKSKAADAPNRFWAMVEPYCADITMDDIRYLEESIKASEDLDEYFKVRVSLTEPLILYVLP